MKKTILCVMMAVCSLNMQAQFSGKGSGTEKDPYQVTNADELFEVRNDLSAYYKVMEDIDLSAWITENSPNYGWAPIGTDSLPFMGGFDGNNKAIKGLFINRPNTDAIGLFGAVLKANIKNVSLIGVNVTGKDYVGALIGRMFIITDVVPETSTIIDNVVLGGSVDGNNNIGGLIGGATFSHNYGITSYPFYHTCKVIGNVTSLDVNGTAYCGGLLGGADGAVFDRTYDWAKKYIIYIYLTINDNFCNSRVEGETAVGGILGHLQGNYKNTNGSLQIYKFLMDEYGNLFDFEFTPYVEMERNITNGIVIGNDNVGGLLGQAEVWKEQPQGKVSCNVCIADTISAVSSKPYRISSFATAGNYAALSTVTLQNHRPVSVEDNDNNGIAYSVNMLKKKTTYIGMGYDFNNQWSIVEKETFPYHITQSTPCQITSFVCGSKSRISGSASGTGKVYVFIGNQYIEGSIIDGLWEVSLGNIIKGTKAKVCVHNDGLAPSVFVTAVAEEATSINKKTGDANGDGVVDSADVTAIINYILGKPSASFNKENADVTGDGEILIDDAVQTVQLIMNAQ